MSTKIWTKDFIMLSLANFFLFASFFILLSSLPLFMVAELHAKEKQVGLIIGVFTVASVIMRPYAGMMLDQLGRRKVVLYSLALFVLASAGYFLVSTLVLLLLLRLIHGGAFGISTTALGTVAVDLVPAQRRGEGLGYYGTFNMLAMVAGPATGLLIIQKLSSGWLFFICFALAVTGLLCSMSVRYPQQGAKREVAGRFSLSDWKKMIEPAAFPYSIPLVGLAVVFGGIVSFISLYASELGDPNLAGGFYFVYALALVSSRIISGKVFDQRGSDLVVYPGILCYVAGLICLGLAHHSGLFYLAGALIGIGYGGIQPCLQALVIQCVPAQCRGAATATFFIAIDAGIGLGSFLLGFVVNWLGYRGMFLSTILFVLVSCFLYWKARRNEMRECGDLSQTAKKFGI
ncbi:MFS transporter [Paenactinomyces guangxiensis]|uniref:MFS transporter n=2 Tax=Paenactinomyces guangxiensis TaxID=1490290 RepID=A0A7W1WRL7_9BACL|nr:MFS transporter [Paenactinomyces guangxiensis]MBA4494591.1 MFS transporter [Paenactinomyces guangxiensis]MBH8591646.1 MFS transporter [Paenactinomyces guangxiensis]